MTETSNPEDQGSSELPLGDTHEKPISSSTPAAPDPASPHVTEGAVPAAPQPVPAKATTRRRSWLRRFFLMEERFAQARAARFQAGKPGWREFERAQAAREGAKELFAVRAPLQWSDGSAGAYSLYLEAAWWAIAAHLAREGHALAPTDEPSLVWDRFQESPQQKLLTALDQEVRARAQLAFVERTWWNIPDLDIPTRRAELKALREVVDRLLSPLETAIASLTRLRIVRWLKFGSVVLGILGVIYGAVSVTKAVSRGPNLALHRPTETSSRFANYLTSSGAVDGALGDFGFHTKVEDEPWLRIDLGSEQTIREVIVHNRRDCCSERAIPLMIGVSNDGTNFREVIRRDKDFTVWGAKFAPVRTRFVKLWVGAKKRSFHLNEIEVYGGR